MKQARGEAPQSGHEVASPEPHRNPSSTPPPVTEEMLKAARSAGGSNLRGVADCEIADIIEAALAARSNQEATPIPMLLYCPQCGEQHIDDPDERTPDWTNPPHRSHLCHGCGCIWRPADVPTNGVAVIETRGKADTWGLSMLAKPVQKATRTVGDAELERLQRIHKAAIRLSDAVTGGGVATTHGCEEATILQRIVEHRQEIINAVTSLNLALREQSKADALSHTSSCGGE